jgi:hypothetical protein
MAEMGHPDRITRLWLPGVDPTGTLQKHSYAGDWIGGLRIADGLIEDDNLPEEVLRVDWMVVGEDMTSRRLLVATWALAASMDREGYKVAACRLSSGSAAALAVPRHRADYSPLGTPLSETVLQRGLTA